MLRSVDAFCLINGAIILPTLLAHSETVLSNVVSVLRQNLYSKANTKLTTHIPHTGAIPPIYSLHIAARVFNQNPPRCPAFRLFIALRPHLNTKPPWIQTPWIPSTEDVGHGRPNLNLSILSRLNWSEMGCSVMTVRRWDPRPRGRTAAPGAHSA